MSTRSCIAVAKGDSWEGVYVHSSGYPTWLGPELWTVLHDRHHNDVHAFAEQAIYAHRCGYSDFPETCYCHSYTDQEESEMIYTAEDEHANAALHIEWVYVVGRHVLTIFKSVPTNRELRIENMTGHWWMEKVYRWAQVAQVSLQGGEPDWEKIEALGRWILDETAHVLGEVAA